VIPKPREDEVVVFRSFIRAGLRFPLYDIIEVLKRFEIYLHQLTPNAIVRLSVYIWALRSQGKSANVEGFYPMVFTKTLDVITLHTGRTPRPR
jgi:hypothetical protein